MELKIEYVPISTIKPYKRNAKLHPQEQIEEIKNSIQTLGFNDPIGVWHDEIVEGHGRYLAAKQLKMKEVPIIRLDELTDEERRAYALAHNKLTMNSGFDVELLDTELAEIGTINMTLLGFEEPKQEEIEVQEDNFDVEPPEEPKAKYGDLYQLGRHRLMCGDSTRTNDVECLMGGYKADMVFTDPPYGMKKEADGVANDNLNFDDLLAFNKQWIPLSFSALKENGSWYCWGIDEPLMDIYNEILKPMQKENKITFRNLLVWDKGSGQGQLSQEYKMYPLADEKCLFVMCGITCLTLNSDQYWEEYEPIRKYLFEQRKLCGWDIPTMKTIAGHSDKSRDHWTGKSQWTIPTEEVYKKFQQWAKDHNIKAFEKEYDDLRAEYDDLRAYFNNTHDNQNDVWHFDRAGKDERVGHATPKPIALCSRAIKSSSRENEIVLDLFGGGGSTLIACEQLNRKCFMMELEPQWVDVIIERWESFTGEKAVLLNGN